MDALGCQTEVVEKIVAQGGDYVLAVKDNQKGGFKCEVQRVDDDAERSRRTQA